MTALVISLAVLCTALYLIVHALQKLVMSGGGEGKIITKLKKILDYPYISMFFGMLLTISVQSSSIVTSTLTPLVGIGVISLEQMLPLTLGANIGTTCTAFLASLVSMKRASGALLIGCYIWPTPASQWQISCYITWRFINENDNRGCLTTTRGDPNYFLVVV